MPFSEIRGQPRVVEYLLNAVSHGRVHHAYLFEGPEGSGKCSAALALAQALNCGGDGGPGGDACGRCSACVRIMDGNHPDVQVFAPEGQFVKIEQMRYLRERSYLKAAEGKWKVFIVDGAHRMNKESANCVLKVLEEPPAGTVLVLAAVDEYSLPETIPSRCTVLPFQSLDLDTVVQVLASRSLRPREELEVIGRISGGNLTEAFRYLDLPWILQVRTEAAELLVKAAAIRPGVELMALAQKIVDLSDTLSEKLEKSGGGVNRFQALGVIYRIWISIIRDWNMISRGLERGIVNQDQAVKLRESAGEVSPGAVTAWLELALKRASDLAGNANRLLSAESLLIDMARARDGVL